MMVKITCGHCSKIIQLDEAKIGTRVVTFPCPVCKTNISVDGRTSPPAVTTAEPPPHQENHENDFGEKALIVGADDPALRQAVKLIGYLPVHQVDAKGAREYYMQEFPRVVIIHPAQLTPPPLDAMSPIISLVPADRRKSFFILVADGLRTLDGNAAFLYGVNLVVAKKDLPQFPQIHRDANTAHERFYASMNAVFREKQLL
jgi:phage FluMu protein Com